MKKVLFIISTFLLLVSCIQKKPIEYYNKAVYAGNMGTSLAQMEAKIERIQEGYDVKPIDLATRTSMRVEVNQNYLDEIKNLLGNEESDPMIRAAIAYLEHDIKTVNNKKTLDLLSAVDQVSQNVELETVFEEYGAYIDSIYGKKEALFEIYDSEVSKYAKTHEIEETFFGRDLQPVEKNNHD